MCSGTDLKVLKSGIQVTHQTICQARTVVYLLQSVNFKSAWEKKENKKQISRDNPLIFGLKVMVADESGQT